MEIKKAALDPKVVSNTLGEHGITVSDLEVSHFTVDERMQILQWLAEGAASNDVPVKLRPYVN